MKRLILALALLPLLAANGGQMVNTGNHRKMFTPTGTTNHARQFNGTSDYLTSAAALSGLNGVGQFSVSFDLYWDNFTNNDMILMQSSNSWTLSPGAVLIDPNSNIAGQTGQFVWSVTSSSS